MSRSGLISEHKEYDVALSFAGAQRGYVEEVSAELRRLGVSYFYDSEEEVMLWGGELTEILQRIYSESASFVVMFISKEYEQGDWPRSERRSALARALRERREYILPAIFDDTELPGLSPATAYIDLRKKTARQLARLIHEKVESLRPRWITNIPVEVALGEPTGIAAFKDHVFVADHARGTVLRIDWDGQTSRQVAGFSRPHHLCVLDDHLLVADTDNNRLVCFDQDLVHRWERRQHGAIRLQRPHDVIPHEPGGYLEGYS